MTSQWKERKDVKFRTKGGNTKSFETRKIGGAIWKYEKPDVELQQKKLFPVKSTLITRTQPNETFLKRFLSFDISNWFCGHLRVAVSLRDWFCIIFILLLSLLSSANWTTTESRHLLSKTCRSPCNKSFYTRKTLAVSSCRSFIFTFSGYERADELYLCMPRATLDCSAYAFEISPFRYSKKLKMEMRKSKETKLTGDLITLMTRENKKVWTF